MIQEFSTLEKAPKLTYKKIVTPKVFIGCNIRSQFDEDRIVIKAELHPNRISHCERNLYGVLFDPKEKDLDLIKLLNSIESIDLISYNNILIKNKMSCGENFGYFEHGLYPVDSEFIEEYIPSFNYQTFFEDDSEFPMFQRIKSVNMFYLTPSKTPKTP